jgi:hypothetical protein
MKLQTTFIVGSGLGLVLFGIFLVASVENAWFWGAGCISLGIAILTSTFFQMLAKITAIACPIFFLLGLIFQRGWLQ